MILKIDFCFCSNFLGQKSFFLVKTVFFGQKSFWFKKVFRFKIFFGSKKFVDPKRPDPKLKKKNYWGPLSSTFHVGRPETLTEWKSESVTYGPTDRLTWVGARDTCVSKNNDIDPNSLCQSWTYGPDPLQNQFCKCEFQKEEM